nr:extracellular solute-binding protein [Streptomyces cahuitamycinicus]
MALGKELQKSRERAVICPNIRHVWSIRLGQLASEFMTEDGRYAGDRDELREAFELAYRIGRDGLSAGAPEGSTDLYGVITSGRQPVGIGAVWWGLAFPESAAPKTEGKWRVADPPGGACDVGGSFLAITKYSKNPEAAYKFITWLQSPENQVKAFTEMSLFPSSPRSFTRPEMREPRPFYGGQRTINDPGKVTLQVAVQQLNGLYTTDQSMVIAGALMSVIPLIGVFLIGSRHFIANLAAGSMKFRRSTRVVPPFDAQSSHLR